MQPVKLPSSGSGSESSPPADWDPNALPHSICLEDCEPLNENSMECSTANPYLDETTGTSANPEEVAAWVFDPPEDP